MFSWFEKRINPFPEESPQRPPEKLFPFLWSMTKGIRKYMILMALLSAAVSIYEAWLFAFLGQVVDYLSAWKSGTLTQAERTRTLVWIVAVMLASILIVALRTTVQHQVLAVNFPMRLRWNFHRMMLGQSISFFSNEFAGRVTAKVMQTALAVREVLMLTGEMLLSIVVYFITIISIAGSFDLMLMLPFIGWILLYSASMSYFLPRLGKAGKEQAHARSTMTGRVTDAYTNINTVKLFAHTNREAFFAREAMQDFIVTGYKQMRLISWFEIINQILVVGLILSAGGYAIWLWHDNAVTAGAVAAVTAMSLRVNGMAQGVMWQMGGLFENIGTVQDGLGILTRHQKVRDAVDAKPLEVTKGDIVFDNVSFNYNGERQVIEQLNLHIKAGEKVGLVGRSGAGKSTLVNLLLRFYDVDSGQIRIDGQDIAKVTQDSLRRSIGMVTQDTSLLHRSIRDNIAYSSPNASDEEVKAAAEKAQAASFIAELEDAQGRRGLDTMVGERGVKLSGGQRQRIAIARVMLKNAPILLLDEATSALDSEVETAIQESLNEMMEGKTVIAIAHRLSTIAAMDRLIVMEQGKIVEQGSHDELLAKNGIYARLWLHQSGGFLGQEDKSEAH